MVEILIPATIIGLISSIIIEILKRFPFLSENDDRKKILALIISLIVCFIYIGSQVDFTTTSTLSFILVALSATYTTFKAVVQPIESIFEPVIRVYRENLK